LALRWRRRRFRHRERLEEASNDHLRHQLARRFRHPWWRLAGAPRGVIVAFVQGQGSPVRAVAQVVLEYLQAHPQAAETV
jgi:hypothetical protein